MYERKIQFWDLGNFLGTKFNPILFVWHLIFRKFRSILTFYVYINRQKMLSIKKYQNDPVEHILAA